MPSTDEILQSLTYLANNYKHIAIIWHLVMYSLLLFLVVSKEKLSNRFVGCFLTLPLLSVSFFAWLANNPFSGMFFLVIAVILFIFSFAAESKQVVFNPSFSLRLAGIVILFFGMIYPHFLGPQFYIYLYAAPIGIIPCATLLMVTGFSLTFQLRQPLKWMLVLLAADLFYGVFGVFRLDVYLDILLLLAAFTLVAQLVLWRRFPGDQHTRSLQRPRGKTIAGRIGFVVIFLFVSAYIFYPWLCRLSVNVHESGMELPGDEIVKNLEQEYTIGTTIKAPASKVWPWLLQMGQGRGGFYTHEWVENILGADIHNADSIVPHFQILKTGDTIWLTPDPYLGKQGQYMTVAQIDSPFVLIYKQVSPNGSVGTWTFFITEKSDHSTRLLFRRRGGHPSVFDRISKPGYYFMDNGMLSGIKQRAELTTQNIQSRHFGSWTKK